MSKLLAVILDIHEAEWVKAIKFGDLVPAIAALHIGDAWLTTEDHTMICVEHKTASDLINSVLDDGLLNQGARMAAEGMFNWRYLIYTMPEVRGEFVVLNGTPTKIRWRHIAGVLVDLQEMGITCISIAADSEYAGTLKWIAERDHGDIHVKAHRRKSIMETPQEHFLSALPGIDTKSAMIMKQFETAAWALDWLTDLHSNFKVSGIASGTKHKVRQLLGLADNMRLAITSTIDIEKENNDD